MRRFLLSFLTITLICYSVHAYTLQGKIIGMDGKFVSDALVIVFDESHQELGRDYSDDNGEYRVSNLKGGTLKLEVTKTKFPKVTVDAAISGSANSTIYQDVNFAEQAYRYGISKNLLIELYLPSEYPLSGSITNLYQKGLEQIGQDKNEKAEQTFKKLVELDPEFSRAYTQLGLIYLTSDHLESAKIQFDIAVSKNCRDPVPLMHLASMEIASKNFEEGILLLKKAESLDPNLPQIKLLLGKAYFNLDKLSEAELVLNELLMKNINEQIDARLLLGDIYLKQSRLIEARDQFKNYLKAKPDAENLEELKMTIRKIESDMVTR